MNQRIQLSDHFTTSRILRFAASPIIMMVFTSIYSVVDGFFVSNFAGKQAFAAVNLIMPFYRHLAASALCWAPAAALWLL